MQKLLKSVQNYSLDLLKVFSEVCDKKHLRYYIIGGTLLGAVRHKGFIPWDDDVDVAMPRSDYEYLISHSDELFDKPYNLVHNSLLGDKPIKLLIAKLENQSVVINMRRAGVIVRKNISIDILPVDGTPDNFFLRQLHYFKLLAYRALFAAAFSDELEYNGANPRTFIEKIIIVIVKTTNIGKLFNGKEMFGCLERTLKKYSLEDKPKIAGTFLGAYKLRELVDARFFTKRVKYKFEDGEFYGTKYYDRYLTAIYGDYMTPPPVKERAGKHRIIKLEKK